MSDVLRRLRERARSANRSIVFPESEDPRILSAAEIFETEGLGHALVFPPSSGVPIPSAVEVVDPDDPRLIDTAACRYTQRRASKGMTLEVARAAVRDRILLGDLMVGMDRAHGCVAGSLATSAHVIRSAIHAVGPLPGRKLLSSFFLMDFEDRAWTYADCGAVPNPNADELAEIAITAAENHERLTGETPRVAMLSFSTKGSAEHEDVTKVRNARERACALAPHLAIDGELQFDAAIVPEIAQRKASGSPVAGHANVFVFPDLDAGNIAYKITERLGGAKALGPLLQGLAKPCMDLSRGCTVQDIVDVAVIAAVLSLPRA